MAPRAERGCLQAPPEIGVGAQGRGQKSTEEDRDKQAGLAGDSEATSGSCCPEAPSLQASWSHCC